MTPASCSEAAGAALMEAVDRARPRLRQLFTWFGVPAWEAEDLVQEALLAALRQWAEIRDLEPWLVAVVRSGCRAYRARQARAWLVTLPDEELERAAAPVRPAQLGREAVLDLRRLLRRLPPRRRQALWWRRGFGYSAEEVSRRLGCTPQAARQLTRRAVVGLSS